MDALQFQLLLAIICVIIYFVVNKRKSPNKNYKELFYDSFIWGATLYSGILIILFSVGKAFDIPFLAGIDNFVLYFFLIFAGFVIIGGSIDDLKKNGK